MLKKNTYIILATLIVFTFIGCSKKVMPISEQKASLNNNVDEMVKEPRYAHLEKYKSKDNPEKPNPYLPLLSNVGVDFSNELEKMSLADFNGSKVRNLKDSKKRKIIMFSWYQCPVCFREMTEELLPKYKEEDFDLAIVQLEPSDKGDLKGEDLKKAIEYDKEIIRQVYEQEGIEKLLDYSVYGKTNELMEALGIEYFPSMIYLNEDNKVINVSGYVNYQGMNLILCKCRDKEI